MSLEYYALFLKEIILLIREFIKLHDKSFVSFPIIFLELQSLFDSLILWRKSLISKFKFNNNNNNK